MGLLHHLRIGHPVLRPGSRIGEFMLREGGTMGLEKREGGNMSYMGLEEREGKGH